MAYLDENGFSYFWGKIKSLINNKLDKTGGVITGPLTVNGPTQIMGSLESENLILGGHATVVGSLLNAVTGAEETAVSANTGMKLLTLSLPAGSWVVQGTCVVGSTSSGAVVTLSVNDSSTSYTSGYGKDKRYIGSNYSCNTRTSNMFVPTSTTTIYLWIYSSVPLTVSYCSIHAMRIA